MRISDWSSDVCSSDLPGADCIARRSPQYALAAGRTRPEVFRKSDAMGLIDRLLGRSDDRETAALYAAIVARARVPHWYIDGGVPDTVDGRFDMIERQSDVQGRSVSVRVVCGGRRILKKKKNDK